MKKFNLIKRTFVLPILCAVMGMGTIAPVLVHAATTNPAPAAKVSFTFDDGLTSAYTTVAPLLKKYGLVGTNYVITGCVGMTKAPNTCHANTDATYMNWTQVQALQNTYGWEIGSHTATHPYLATKDASDGQPKVLTQSQVITELTQSKTALKNHGIDAKAFASPYGDYNNAVLTQIAKLYQTQRGFADVGLNSWPNNEYLLYDFPVQSGVSVAQVEAQVDKAIANKQWLVLTFHDIKAKPSTNPDDYEYSTANLQAIAAYVQKKQAAGLIQSSKVSSGVVGSDQNMLTNGTFASGLTGWTTDNTTAIKANAGNNGSYPQSADSVAFTNQSGTSHLFSQRVRVNYSTTYMLKSFLNLRTSTGGSVGYYIDEYDANGNWISGQYKRAEANAFVEDMNFSYKPTSANVNQASVQVIFSGAASGFVDNFSMFALSSDTAVNLMPGGSFDQGISNGWRTDNAAAITAHSTTTTGGTTHDIQLGSVSTGEAHLFSPTIAVTAGRQYSVVNHLNIQTIGTGGLIGFYIDEYDVSGNWISGQYRFDTAALGARDVSFSYLPSSANVTSASLQVIVGKTTGTVAYLDDSRWYVVN